MSLSLPCCISVLPGEWSVGNMPWCGRRRLACLDTTESVAWWPLLQVSLSFSTCQCNVWCEMTSHIFFVFFVFDNVIVLRLHTLWFGICKLRFPLRWKMFVAIFLGEFCCEIPTTICITSLILLVSPSILNLLFFLQSWWRSCRWNGPIFTLEVHSSSHYLDASSI